MKKILFVHHGKGLGGAPLSLLYLVESLDRKKYHPIVLFLHDSEVINLFKEKGIETIGPINVYDFAHTKIWWFRWKHVDKLTRAIKDTFKTRFFIAPKIFDAIKPDIVHLNTSSLIGWGIAAHKKKIPVVWHVREPLASGYCGIRKRIVQKVVATCATAITPICINDAKPWKDNPKTQVIYNAVQEKFFDSSCDPSAFLHEHALVPSDPKILFLGGLSQEKGTSEILMIFKQVLEQIPDAKLLIAGYLYQPTSGWKKTFFPASKYATTINKLFFDLEHSIVRLGPIRGVPSAMAASSVVVFPATVGHFARPIIEAGFMKKPVVASATPPLDELVIDKKTGFLIDINDHEQWAQKLCLLLSDKQQAQAMGNAAYDFCLQKFSLQEQIKKIEALYDQVLIKETHG